MSAIHTMLSQGSGVQLGPVTIDKVYPFTPGGKNIFMLISDASGKGALKIWGAAANGSYQPGQQITLVGTGPKGGLKVSEYQGKTSIDANDCRVEFGGGGGSVEAAQPAPAGYQPRQAPAPSVTSGKGTIEDVAKQAARGTALYIDELVVNHGFSRDEAIMLAQGAHTMFPIYWGGEKFLP